MALRLPRIIPRLDIKGENVVKGISFEGLRVVGKPEELARKYAEDADELLYIDTVASLYGRNQLTELLRRTTDETFIPITVGGGIKSKDDARRLFDAGADKIAINTAALKRPALIDELASFFGSQAVVLSIQAKRVSGGWEAYCEAGRERSGKNAVDWAFEAADRGAGEILLTSVDQDGTRKGFDCELLRLVADKISVPVTICGGLGRSEDLQKVPTAHGVAMASVLHYGEMSVSQIRRALDGFSASPCISGDSASQPSSLP